MAQTLGQLRGSVWRLSHPLVGAYRLAAQIGHDRQIWLKRLAEIPPAYAVASCCRAPLLPLLTREAFEDGLVCHHCNQIAVPLAEVPDDLRAMVKSWGAEYAPVHAVAHQEQSAQQSSQKYEHDLEQAAAEAKRLLIYASQQMMPKFLDYYAAAVWEDQDECLQVRPEDLSLSDEPEPGGMDDG